MVGWQRSLTGPGVPLSERGRSVALEPGASRRLSTKKLSKPFRKKLSRRPRGTAWSWRGRSVIASEGAPIAGYVGQLPGARDRLPITGCQLQESLAAGRRSLFPRPPRLGRRLHLLLRTGPSPTPCRGDEEPDAAGRPSTDTTTGRPGVMCARQWGTLHSIARTDETDAAGRPSTDVPTGRPGAMRVSQRSTVLVHLRR